MASSGHSALCVHQTCTRLQSRVFTVRHRGSSMSKSKLPDLKSVSLAKSTSSRPLREWQPRLSSDLHTHPHMHVNNNDNHLITYSYLNMAMYQLCSIQ